MKKRVVWCPALVLAIALPAAAGDFASDMKKAGQSIGKAAEDLGKQVAKESKKVGKEAEHAWFETSKWATRESKHVADATVAWWDGAIHDKEAKRDRLRRENEELKDKAAKEHR